MKARGFALMEVLVVIAVLAILIGIATPRMKGFQEQAKIQKAKSELKTLEAALAAYYIHNNAYPPTTEAVSGTYLLNDTNPLIDRVLYDPFGDGTQEYNYLVDGNYWAVSSRGSDRVRNVPILSDGNLLVAAGVDDLAQTNGIVATCAEGGYADCGGSCNDLQTDTANCGSCGAAGGPDCCAGLPVDVQTDADNCGSCGAAGGPDCCVGLPVDLWTDEVNCGTCGNVCGANYVCQDGACIDACLAADAGPGTDCVDGTIYVTAVLRTTPSDVGPLWWSIELIATGVTDTSDGETNTTTLAGLGDYPAADACLELSFGDKYDWYLPAKDQLVSLYTYRVEIGGFWSNRSYWSSTESVNPNHAVGKPFSSASSINYGKNSGQRVRCVRSP